MSQDEYSKSFEPLWDQVNIYDGVEAFTASITGIPQAQLVLYAAHFCLSELQNGGLLQFFWNNTGILFPEAAEGFSALGMPRLAISISEAADLLGRPYPRDRNERWTALLVASGLEEGALKKIFAEEPKLYMAFAEATRNLGFGEREHLIWELAEAENGGFQYAAVQYANKLETLTTNTTE